MRENSDVSPAVSGGHATARALTPDVGRDVRTPNVDARTRLLAVLGDVARDVTASALDRCPYRARDDRCTFGHGCRNQMRKRGTAVVHCSGAPLNTNSSSNSYSNSMPKGQKRFTRPAHQTAGDALKENRSSGAVAANVDERRAAQPRTKTTTNATATRHTATAVSPRSNSNSNSNSNSKRGAP
jgi:hypothetical protein